MTPAMAEGLNGHSIKRNIRWLVWTWNMNREFGLNSIPILHYGIYTVPFPVIIRWLFVFVLHTPLPILHHDYIYLLPFVTYALPLHYLPHSLPTDIHVVPHPAHLPDLPYYDTFGWSSFVC